MTMIHPALRKKNLPSENDYLLGLNSQQIVTFIKSINFSQMLENEIGVMHEMYLDGRFAYWKGVKLFQTIQNILHVQFTRANYFLFSAEDEKEITAWQYFTKEVRMKSGDRCHYKASVFTTVSGHPQHKGCLGKWGMLGSGRVLMFDQIESESFKDKKVPVGTMFELSSLQPAAADYWSKFNQFNM